MPTTALARLFLVCAFALLAACGTKTTTPGAVDTLCAAGEQKCFGNIMASCGSGGKAWNLTQCGADKICQSKETNGTTVAQCANTVCQRGSSVCVGSDVSKSCSLDGLTETITNCTASQTCEGGICVSQKCAGTAKKCGWKSVLTCTSSAWALVDCKDSEICDPATYTCVPQACNATQAICTDDTHVQVCDEIGSNWTVSACGAGEICDQGICHLPVSGVSTGGDDATSGDDGMTTADAGKDVKQLIDVGGKDIGFEKNDEFICTLSETQPPPAGTDPTSFPNVTMNWIDSLGTLVVSGVDGANKVEIQVGPIEDGQTGKFTQKGAEAGKSRVGYDNGAGPVGAGAYEYEATDYTIQIDQFDGSGGRVKGTFSAALQSSATGKVMYVIDGSFDVKRN